MTAIPFVRLVALAAALATAPGRAAELAQQPQRNVIVPGTLAPDAGEAPASDKGPDKGPDDGPDERPLWRLLTAGGYPTLDARIARLRGLYPGWHPPARMVELAAQDADERALARAKAQHDWAAVRRLAASHPSLATCARPDDAAVVAAAPGAPSSLDAALAACPDDATRVALLGAAFDRFGPGPVAPLLDRVADAAPMPQAARSRLRAIGTELAMQRLGTTLAAGSPVALDQGEALRAAIEARRDAGTAAALGWAALKANRPQAAVSWFTAARRYDPAQPAAGLARAELAAGNPGAARSIMAQMQGGAALLAELDEAQVAAAFRRGAYAEAAALAARQPDPPLLLGWSLLRLRQPDAAAHAFERRYARHHEDAAAEGLVLSLTEAGRFDELDAAAERLGGAVAAAQRIAPGPGEPLGGSDTGYRLALARLRRALDRHDAAMAARMAAVLAGPVAACRDADAATTLGWAALDAGRLPDAARWFALGAQAAGTREDAEYGGALVAFEEGDEAAVEAASAAHPGSARWGRLQVDALMAQAQREADASPGSPEAERDARSALRLDPTRRDASLLLAWSDYHDGRHAEAAAAFERLYLADPDAASATGLATASDDLVRLGALGAAFPGPLGIAVAQRNAQDAYARKDFLAAAQAEPAPSPALAPALANFGTPSFGLSETYRSKSGGTGTSRLESTALDVFGSLTHDTDRVTVRLHLVTLDAGRAPPGNGAARLTTRLPLGVEPLIAWERQPGAAPALSPFAELGTTSLGGVVGPTVQGRAGLGWWAPGGSARVAGYRQSITESVLSFTGIIDPATGRRFGRVTETGATVQGYIQVLPRWGVFAQVGGGVRDGVGVASNGHVQAAATLSYDLRVPGFDSFTLGPSYQFSHFNRDLSGFTPGQGGYYSPAASHVAGAALRLLTREAQGFSVRASSFVGWQFARSAGAADGQGGRLAASRQDGFNAVGEVLAAYRLSEHWVAGGMVRYQVSPQFNDLYAGLSLAYSLGSRAAVLSADLPRFDAR